MRKRSPPGCSLTLAATLPLRGRDETGYAAKNLRPASHPERHRLGIAARQVAVARQRPERKEFRVAVVAQIEHARETGGGVVGLVPEAVGALHAGEIIDAARDRRMLDLARRHQAEQRPGGL